MSNIRGIQSVTYNSSCMHFLFFQVNCLAEIFRPGNICKNSDETTFNFTLHNVFEGTGSSSSNIYMSISIKLISRHDKNLREDTMLQTRTKRKIVCLHFNTMERRYCWCPARDYSKMARQQNAVWLKFSDMQHTQEFW